MALFVVVTVDGYWAKGASIEEAKKNARKEGADLRRRRLVFRMPEDSPPESVFVDGYGMLHWFSPSGKRYERLSAEAERS